jgi:hypothetical protein
LSANLRGSGRDPDLEVTASLDADLVRSTLDRLATDLVIQDLLEQIRALVATTTSRSYIPYWSMRTATLAREVQSWAVSSPSPARREAVHASLLSLRAQIAHHSNAA